MLLADEGQIIGLQYSWAFFYMMTNRECGSFEDLSFSPFLVTHPDEKCLLSILFLVSLFKEAKLQSLLGVQVINLLLSYSVLVCIFL